MGKKRDFQSDLKKLENTLTRKKVLSTAELQKILGNRPAIKKAVNEGSLVQLGNGLYSAPSLDPFTAMLFATHRYYPNAIISHLTALVVHRLSDENLNQVDVDIDRKTTLKNKVLRVHRVSAAKRIGIIKMNYMGATIRIYDIERTLCEAYRIDPAGPIFFKAVKRYLKQYNPPKLDRIHLYDTKLGTKALRHLRQELADA